MRAIVATGYGTPEVLKLTKREIPTPGESDVLIRVVASNVTAADSMMRRGDPAYARLFLGLTKPKAPIPGTGLAGVVEATGSAVARFQIGDEVFGESGTSFGAHAEYVCVPEDGVLLPKPAFLSFDDAAAICDGPLTSFNFLRRMADIQPGQRVLINGASGALGSAAVQLAKAFGATVTGVCSSKNLEFVSDLGADEVIDYTSRDFTQEHNRYDVIYDSVGKSSYRRSKRALAPGGAYLSPVLSIPLLFQMLASKFGNKSAKFDATGLRKADELRGFLTELLDMVRSGKLRSVVERIYPLDRLIEAHALVDSGHKRGTLIVRMDG
ncbi:MAG: NAD(P)-dependent alcohol dehydrogenase [Myxococcales bacterium]|nr:NAD(P)-dependent alcohol dehydrogenase [Myxococcales bacterium]